MHYGAHICRTSGYSVITTCTASAVFPLQAWYFHLQPGHTSLSTHDIFQTGGLGAWLSADAGRLLDCHSVSGVQSVISIVCRI